MQSSWGSTFLPHLSHLILDLQKQRFKLISNQIETLTCYVETFHMLLLLQHAAFQTAGLYELAFWHPL